MNEQGSKKILFNRTTLFSLKAELLRKQEEVQEKKQLPQHKLENFKPPPAKSSDHEKNDKEYKRTFKDSLKQVDTEELEACRKAKIILEKKAELYDHLSDGAGSSQLAGRFLVDFNTKNKEEPSKPALPSEPSTEALKETNENDDDEWTEFTDCLGRTRKCHKSDLEMYQQRDTLLLRALNKDQNVPDDNTTTENVAKETPLLVQKTNDYLLSLREKWEQKEQELLAKDKDIHYQDLLFDEARMHGVGYYNFSTDETKRRKEMEELIKRREETLKAQQDAEQARKKRDEMMAARVAAARARQRARAGLPPEEPKGNEKDFTTCLLEFLTQQKNEADAKANEEDRKRKEEQEKERQKLRETYIREWDLGKEGLDDKVKKFREMTQEEYVDQQRDKRIKEFAPTHASSSKNDYSFDNRGKRLDTSEPPPKTWAEVRPKPNTPPPPDIGVLPSYIETKGLYFSSKKEATLKYRNFVKPQEPIPIVDELEFGPGPSESDRSKTNRMDASGVQIAPPPTYDYYGPVPKQAKIQKPFQSDLWEAYAQGSRSLETKPADKKISKLYDFTFD